MMMAELTVQLHLLTGVCDLNELIYCIGGWNGQVGIKQCDVLDPITGQWSSIAPLQTGADHGTIVRLQAITVMLLKFQFFWVVTRQMCGSQLFKGFQIVIGLLDRKDVGAVILQIVRNHLPTGSITFQKL